MRILLIQGLLVFILSGCEKASHPKLETTSEEIRPVDLLRKRLKSQKEIVFYSAKPGPTEWGSCKLHLKEDSKVSLNTAGINFGSYHGVYFVDHNRINLTFPDSARVLVPGFAKFPTLILTEDNGILILNREDGINNLDEEGNIWPDPHDGTPPVFPLETKAK